jgi:hypothetical protein
MSPISAVPAANRHCFRPTGRKGCRARKMAGCIIRASSLKSSSLVIVSSSSFGTPAPGIRLSLASEMEVSNETTEDKRTCLHPCAVLWRRNSAKLWERWPGPRRYNRSQQRSCGQTAEHDRLWRHRCGGSSKYVRPKQHKQWCDQCFRSPGESSRKPATPIRKSPVSAGLFAAHVAPAWSTRIIRPLACLRGDRLELGLPWSASAAQERLKVLAFRGLV